MQQFQGRPDLLSRTLGRLFGSQNIVCHPAFLETDIPEYTMCMCTGIAACLYILAGCSGVAGVDIVAAHAGR